MKRNRQSQISVARLMGLVAMAALLCFGWRAAERKDFVGVCNFVLILFVVDASLFGYSQQLRPSLAGAIIGGSGYLLAVVNLHTLQPETLMERPDSTALLFAAHGAITLIASFTGGLVMHRFCRSRHQHVTVARGDLPKFPC